jgi:predicted adenylyl cyclase CyaB
MSKPTLEIELKARIDDVAAARKRVEAAGAVLVFEGELADRIYDSAARTFLEQDLVLRLRTYTDRTGVSAHLDWKGPTLHENGFKLRTELTTGVSEPDALASILEGLGYSVIRSIDRHIAQYELTGTGTNGTVVIRFERYPRMDELVEVEGSRESIENAIRVLQIPRDRFVGDRLTDFVNAYEARTGMRAAVCEADCGAD